LAGVIADHEDLAPTRRQEVLPFDPHAITTTQFVPASLPELLTETQTQLHDALTLIYPHALAA
jgi:hypothetical protein